MSGILLLILRGAMAVLLYAFLGWALSLLLRDLRRESEKIRARQLARITLTLEAEPEARLYQFNQTEVLIGRDPLCDLEINDSAVSSQHARLSFHHNQWWVDDLKSRNGTLLNDELVTTAVVLTSDDKIRCGGSNTASQNRRDISRRSQLIEAQAKLAVIGGSGLYEMPTLLDIQEFDVDTPFGKPSAPSLLAHWRVTSCGLSARHGYGHHISLPKSTTAATFTH
jgi:pSer/pThr/pTyr-binding forkhead associated (FHA) protein